MLTTALDMADGNAILVVIDFLQATLSAKLRAAELQLDVTGVAMKHYLLLLKQQGQWDKYLSILSAQGRHQERLMVQYLRETSLPLGAKSDPLIDERTRMNHIQSFAENHLSENSTTVCSVHSYVFTCCRKNCYLDFCHRRNCGN